MTMKRYTLRVILFVVEAVVNDGLEIVLMLYLTRIFINDAMCVCVRVNDFYRE